MSELRNVAVRALKNESHILYDARIHQRVVNYLFTAYFTSPYPEEIVAVEMWACYRHLLEGGAVSELPISLINKRAAVAAIRKILRGELVLFDDPETLDQGDHNDQREHGEQSQGEGKIEVVCPVRIGHGAGP